MPLSPVLLIRTALGLVDEARKPETPMPLVERYLRQVAAPRVRPRAGQLPEWSTAFVHYAGYWSHYEPTARYSLWPLPPTRSAAQLAAFADKRGILASDEPQYGDVYLLWSPARKTFVRAGIVADVKSAAPESGARGRFECLTIDGCTDHAGSPSGKQTLVITRTLCPADGDRLVRWVDLAWSDIALSMARDSRTRGDEPRRQTGRGGDAPERAA